MTYLEIIAFFEKKNIMNSQTSLCILIFFSIQTDAKNIQAMNHPFILFENKKVSEFNTRDSYFLINLSIFFFL